MTHVTVGLPPCRIQTIRCPSSQRGLVRFAPPDRLGKALGKLEGWTLPREGHAWSAKRPEPEAGGDQVGAGSGSGRRPGRSGQRKGEEASALCVCTPGAHPASRHKGAALEQICICALCEAQRGG